MSRIDYTGLLWSSSKQGLDTGKIINKIAVMHLPCKPTRQETG
jgi:hypothetical protein